MADVFNFYVYDDRTIQFELAEPIMLEDSNVTQFQFRIPKVLNELDMHTWAWWFVYENASAEKYSVPLILEDDEDDPDNYSLAIYTVDAGMSGKAGSIRFALEVIDADATTSEILHEWHTRTYTTPVVSTLQGNEREFTPSEYDLISAKLEEIIEMIEGGGGGSTSDDITNESTVSGETVTDALSSLNDQIANLEGGAPTPAATVSAMVDTSKIYLYTGSETGYTAGHWYYYSGGAWTDGGVYGAVSSNVFSDYAKETLITILRSAMYTSDQSGNINRLEDALARQVLSIGATVDLGGNTIYTDDELDTLRQYLTVTATYDDMTTSHVTGYALSGTLVAGTSTITITYQGNSTTVSVPVSQAVVRYAVTYNLTGVTSSNTDATIAEGNTYTTTLTAETAGYIPTDVVITMGGTDVTATAYNASTHVVNIANVSGAISITAVEAEDPNAPAFELTSPLVLGDATDPRINLPDTCQVATGVTIADNETWTICIDFTSATGVTAVQNTRVFINDRNTSLYYSAPNWVILWHNGTQNIVNDRVNGAWGGKNMICVLTHEAGATVANLYGTVSGEMNNTHTLENAGQIKLGSVTGAGTINKFAIYKRVLTASEIAEWTGV